MTKEFLNGSEMRRIKSLNGASSPAQPNKAQVAVSQLDTSLVHSPNPAYSHPSLAEMMEQDGTVVAETPFQEEPNPKPPDPMEATSSEQEVDAVMVEDAAGEASRENSFAPLGEDEIMA
ncbi:hypothetical protein PIB30_070467 [Stylosanthes scabra]|uniref:Uncharacterized protein n=1 Tax=Stylosanthes scabra TaxID=79078 RepID=A0ABU6TNN4_9FABA|nr:hypothetical protein [Stylosanthes scabra]